MTPVVALHDRGTLANGIPFAVCHRAGADVTTVSVWILSGSCHETVPGVAHLLEHVVMQAVPAGRSMRVVDEIEATGGEVNAITARDHVVLYARVPTVDAAASLAVLADAVTSSTFDGGLVRSERRVVREELRLAAADPTDIVHDVFFEIAYGEHPMGRPVGGTAAGVARLGVAELAAWARWHVRPGLLGVAVSGGLTASAVAEALATSPLATLATSPPATLAAADERPAPPKMGAPELTEGRRDLAMVTDTAAVVLGGPAFALDDPRLAVAEIVIELLAGGNASILNEELRSRRGLSYDISGDACGYRDAGVWRVAITTAPEHRDLVVDLASGLLSDAVGRGWTQDEVAVARRRVAGLLRLEVESSLEDALLLGTHTFIGGRADWSLRAHLERFATIDADEVNRCARLMSRRLVVATAGGVDGEVSGGDRRAGTA